MLPDGDTGDLVVLPGRPPPCDRRNPRAARAAGTRALRALQQEQGDSLVWDYNGQGNLLHQYGQHCTVKTVADVWNYGDTYVYSNTVNWIAGQ